MHAVANRIGGVGLASATTVRTCSGAGPDAIAAYYRPQAVSGPAESGGYDATATCPDVPYLLGISFPCNAHITVIFAPESSSLEPWLPDLGWAKPGRIWLAITDVSYWVDPVITVAPGGGSFAIRDDRTFTIELPDGREVPALSNGDARTRTQQPTALVFDLPATFTTGTLVVRPSGRLIVAGKTDHWSKPPPAKRIRLILAH